MKSNYIIVPLLLVLLSGCQNSNNNSTSVSESDSTVSADKTEAALIAGEWKVGGVVYKGKVVDIDDEKTIADLYDSRVLTIRDDNTYSLLEGPFQIEGNWSETWKDGYEYAYTLNSTSSARYTIEDGRFALGESKEISGKFKAYLDNDDHNTLFYIDPDSEIDLIYVRSGEESQYIAGNKIQVNPKQQSEKPNSEVASGTVSQSKTENKKKTQNSQPSSSNMTAGEKNALSKAHDYLSFTAFSHSGLIEQLKFEGYSGSEAKYAADHCGADWYEQACLKAKDYLSFTAFSYSGLIEQLEFEGFTADEAEYGADSCGADWYEQAVKKAKEYLAFSSFSKSSLIDQLIFEGFTADQANYGADHAY